MFQRRNNQPHAPIYYRSAPETRRKMKSILNEKCQAGLKLIKLRMNCWKRRSETVVSSFYGFVRECFFLFREKGRKISFWSFQKIDGSFMRTNLFLDGFLSQQIIEYLSTKIAIHEVTVWAKLLENLISTRPDFASNSITINCIH